MRTENSGLVQNSGVLSADNMTDQKFVQMQDVGDDLFLFESTFIWGNTTLVETPARGINFPFLIARYKIKIDHTALGNRCNKKS